MTRVRHLIAIGILLVYTAPFCDAFLKAALGLRIGLSPTEKGYGQPAQYRSSPAVKGQFLTGVHGEAPHGMPHGHGPSQRNTGGVAMLRHLKILGVNLYLGGPRKPQFNEGHGGPQQASTKHIQLYRGHGDFGHGGGGFQPGPSGRVDYVQNGMAIVHAHPQQNGQQGFDSNLAGKVFIGQKPQNIVFLPAASQQHPAYSNGFQSIPQQPPHVRPGFPLTSLMMGSQWSPKSKYRLTLLPFARGPPPQFLQGNGPGQERTGGGPPGQPAGLAHIIFNGPPSVPISGSPMHQIPAPTLVKSNINNNNNSPAPQYSTLFPVNSNQIQAQSSTIPSSNTISNYNSNQIRPYGPQQGFSAQPNYHHQNQNQNQGQSSFGGGGQPQMQLQMKQFPSNSPSPSQRGTPQKPTTLGYPTPPQTTSTSSYYNSLSFPGPAFSPIRTNTGSSSERDNSYLPSSSSSSFGNPFVGPFGGPGNMFGGGSQKNNPFSSSETQNSFASELQRQFGGGQKQPINNLHSSVEQKEYPLPLPGNQQQRYPSHQNGGGQLNYSPQAGGQGSYSPQSQSVNDGRYQSSSPGDFDSYLPQNGGQGNYNSPPGKQVSYSPQGESQGPYRYTEGPVEYSEGEKQAEGPGHMFNPEKMPFNSPAGFQYSHTVSSPVVSMGVTTYDDPPVMMDHDPSSQYSSQKSSSSGNKYTGNNVHDNYNANSNSFSTQIQSPSSVVINPKQYATSDSNLIMSSSSPKLRKALKKRNKLIAAAAASSNEEGDMSSSSTEQNSISIAAANSVERSNIIRRRSDTLKSPSPSPSTSTSTLATTSFTATTTDSASDKQTPATSIKI